MLNFPFPAFRGEIFQKWQYDGVKWVCRCTEMGEMFDMKTIVFTVWTASGIHIPAPGMLFALIEMMGCGGGGEPVMPNGTNYFCGRGAGAGAYMKFMLNAQQFGSQRQVTICPGGMMGQFTKQQKQTQFGQSWVDGGLDANDNNGYGGYQGSFEGSPIGWSAPISKAVGAISPTFTPAVAGSNCYFHEGEAGHGGICFQNQAQPMPGQQGPMGSTVQMMGKGGMGHSGGTAMNHTIAPDPPGWDGAYGCGGSGSICRPTDPAGVQIPAGKGGGGVVIVIEFCDQ